MAVTREPARGKAPERRRVLGARADDILAPKEAHAPVHDRAWALNRALTTTRSAVLSAGQERESARQAEEKDQDAASTETSVSDLIREMRERTGAAALSQAAPCPP